MEPDKKYQLIRFTVSLPRAEVLIDEETNKLYKFITGINALVSDTRAVYSTLPLQLNGKEIFPDGWEVLRIKFRENAPHNVDFHDLRLDAAGTRIKGKYTDSGQAFSYPYTVSICLQLENNLNNPEA